MLPLLSFLNDVVYDALPYMLVCLGIVWTAKYIRFPDLTCSGTFVLGGALAALTIVEGEWPLAVALPVAAAGGAAGGLLTAFFYLGLRMDRILSGILSAFVLYSVNLLLLAPTLAYQQHRTPFSTLEILDRQIITPGIAVAWHPYAILFMAVMVIVVKAGMDWFLASEQGLVLRALEDEEAGETTLRRLGLSPNRYRTLALVAGNGLIAVAGAVVSFKEGAASAHRGFDVLITGLIAFLVGSQIHAIAHRLSAKASSRSLQRALQINFTTAAIGGAAVFFVLVTLSQRLAIDPGYAKIVLAVLVAASAADPSVFRRPRGVSAGPSGYVVPAGGGLALEVRKLRYRYPASDVDVFDGVDFSVRTGELVRVRGRNGSGKTTALRLIAGYLDGDYGGRILIGGADLTSAPLARLRDVIYLEQDARRGVVGVLSALENLALFSCGRRRSAWRRALSATRAEQLARTAMEAGLPVDTLLRGADQLSGGQRQTVNLLTVLVRPEKPKAVLLDEPLNNLDEANQSRCTRLIESMHSEGIAVVMVSHAGMSDAFKYREINLDDDRPAPAIIKERIDDERRIAR